MENEKDRFYVVLQNDTIEWMYYNPDSDSGGQFVLNTPDENVVVELEDIEVNTNE